MKAVSLIIAYAFASFFLEEPLQQKHMETAIEESDFVGFVIYDNHGGLNQDRILTATKVFKGDLYQLIFKKRKCGN